MRQYNDGHYARITKTEARRRFDSGEAIAICASNLRPGAFWYPECTIKKRGAHDLFENKVNAFEFYNCINSETGRKAAFYKIIGGAENE